MKATAGTGLLLPFFAAQALAADPVITVGTAQDIVVDGLVDEAAWDTVPPVTELLRFQPTAGGPPPGTTEVRFLQDDKYLYASVRVTHAGYPIRARISGREDINADDQVGLYLDTFRDRRSGYVFYLNPLGVQQDFRRNGDAYNFSWDAVFRSEGHVTDDGYELEIAWPWRSLRYARDASEWGVILTRKIPGEGAKYGFPVLERGSPQWFAQAAALQGLTPPRRGTGVELLPQLTVVQSATRQDDALDWTGWDQPLAAARPSLDARVGLTRNLGLSATANPDFSQVEFDVTPVNLNQRFAFFFRERRPFFLEGSEYFEDQTQTLYTRSIVQPWGGVKVAGREGPWQVGVLSALDRTPAPSVHERGAPGFDQVDGATAATQFARLTHDLAGTGTVGVSVANKALWGGGDAATHTLATADMDAPLGGRWTMAAAHTQSWTGAAGDVPLWGMENLLDLARRSGVGTGVSLYLRDRTVGLRKETGFMTRSGVTTGNVSVDHTFEPGGAVNTVQPWLSASVTQERSGDAAHRLTVGQGTTINGTQGLRTRLWVGDRLEQGTRAQEWSARLEAWGQVGSTFEAWGSVEAGRVLDFQRFVPARNADVEGGIVLRSTTGVRLDTNARWSTFRPDGADRRRATRLRANLRWQLTKPLGVRLLTEHNTVTGRAPALTSSLLVTWLHHPGTAVWLGASEVRPLVGDGKVASRAVFLKASLLLRP